MPRPKNKYLLSLRVRFFDKSNASLNGSVNIALTVDTIDKIIPKYPELKPSQFPKIKRKTYRYDTTLDITNLTDFQKATLEKKLFDKGYFLSQVHTDCSIDIDRIS